MSSWKVKKLYQETSEDSFNLEPVSHDHPEVFTNNQSDYFVLSAPEKVWRPELYCLDLFVGEEVPA
jgi:hypothetical protein